MPILTIKRGDIGAVIYTGEAATIADLLANAVNDHVDFYRASLVGASLIGASLDGARLDGASLVGARLDGARLDGARLDGASLDGARLDGARLVGALIGEHVCAGPFMQLTGVAEWGSMVAYVAKDSGLRVIVRCRHFSIEEAHEHWASRNDREMTRVALAMVEQWSKSVKGTA